MRVNEIINTFTNHESCDLIQKEFLSFIKRRIHLFGLINVPHFKLTLPDSKILIVFFLPRIQDLHLQITDFFITIFPKFLISKILILRMTLNLGQIHQDCLFRFFS